ncbi:MAG: hypothetical protein K2L01_00610 [Rikenellaceae bacterium]|nr:hypothetical protein [Rikenellaceae bacterium]
MNAKWSSLDKLTADYRALGGDIEEFGTSELYVTVACHAAIDGSSLTVGDASRLFDLGLAVGDRPLVDYLAVSDLKEAYMVADSEIAKGAEITPELLRRLNGTASARTGRERIGGGGIWDERKGEYRIDDTAGERSVYDRRGVAAFVDTFCMQLREAMSQSMSPSEWYELSFKAAYNLSSISPWSLYGNATALIAMYMVQRAGGLVPTAVAPDLKEEYLKSLAISKEYRNIAPFVNFMKTAHIKHLKEMSAVSLAAERKKYLSDAQKHTPAKTEDNPLEGLFALMPEENESSTIMLVEDEPIPADLPKAVDLNEIEF